MEDKAAQKLAAFIVAKQLEMVERLCLGTSLAADQEPEQKSGDLGRAFEALIKRVEDSSDGTGS